MAWLRTTIDMPRNRSLVNSTTCAGLNESNYIGTGHLLDQDLAAKGFGQKPERNQYSVQIKHCV